MSRFSEKRLAEILQDAKEYVLFSTKKMKDRDKDKYGCASRSLRRHLKRYGLLEYLVNADVIAFRKNLQASAQIQLKIIQRFDQGEPISESLVSMFTYPSLFHAMAANDFVLAKALATVMGGRYELEKRNSHPFPKTFGYALKSVVLNAEDQIEKVAAFRERTTKRGCKSYAGYADAFEAIYNNDTVAFHNALENIAKSYKRIQDIKYTIDELLCIYGVGVVNLGKHRGMDIQFDHPFIPAVLTT